MLVKACTDQDQAIKAYDFELARTGGDALHPRLPTRAYSDPFEVVRSGCGEGWMVFELPGSDRAETVGFTYDDTGANRSGRSQKHLRFKWKVGR